MIKRIVLLLLLSPLSNLMAQSNNDTLPYATVYVYRKLDKVASFSTFHLLMSNAVFKELKSGRLKNYIVIPVKVFQESDTQFHTTAETIQSAYINIQFGKEYYVGCKIISGLIVKASLEVVPKEQALMDIDEIRKEAKKFE